MNKTLKCAALCTVLFTLVACSKKEEEAAVPAADAAAPAEAPAEAAAAAPAPPTPAGAETVPGENAVRAALEAKDYEGAVSRLLAMRGNIRKEQWGDYVILQGQVREALMEAAETDRKAAEPLMTLRAVMSGR